MIKVLMGGWSSVVLERQVMDCRAAGAGNEMPGERTGTNMFWRRGCRFPAYLHHTVASPATCTGIPGYIVVRGILCFFTCRLSGKAKKTQPIKYDNR
jgi:hypothetical protein